MQRKPTNEQELEKILETYSSPHCLAEYLCSNHDLLTAKCGTQLLFDIIYDRALASYSREWQESLLRILKTIDPDDEEDVKITENRRYILLLQSSHNSYLEIFRSLLLRGFDMDDPEFLVYSLVARGELEKLKFLASYYKIEDYPAIFDVALRYGRNEILEYLIYEVDADPAYYGNVMDFENFVDNPRYLYYRPVVSNVAVSSETPAIVGSRQDYIASIKLIMETYPNPVTVHTLEVWCEALRNKFYLWDKGKCSGDVIQFIKSYVKEPIPLTMDFCEFNRDVFSLEWSDRKHIIEHCLSLHEQLEELRERHMHVLERLRSLQDNCDSGVHVI